MITKQDKQHIGARQMKAKQLMLWKYNKVAGYWQVMRDVQPSTKAEQLALYQKDEPNEVFKVSKIKPK